MMGELIHALSTPVGMVIYFLGVASACVWHYAKARWTGVKKQSINWSTMGIILGVSAMVFLMMQNTSLSNEVQRCHNEFATRLATRAAITDENDALSREHRFWIQKTQQAVGDLIKLAWMPDDPALAKLDVGDPQRTSYTAGLVVQYQLRISRYSDEIQRITKRQDEVVADRAAHPLPPPTCGENQS
jgi:hypothetical protein